MPFCVHVYCSQAELEEAHQTSAQLNAAASASQASLAEVQAEASEAASSHAHAYAAAQEAIEEANARALAAEQQLDALRLEGVETPEQVRPGGGAVALTVLIASFSNVCIERCLVTEYHKIIEDVQSLFDLIVWLSPHRLLLLLSSSLGNSPPHRW